MSDHTLVGREITAVRSMTDEELADNAWGGRRGGAPIALELDDGTVLYPSQDPEGNGPGALFGEQDGDHYMFLPGE